MKEKLKPTNDNLLIKPEEEETQTASGLLIYKTTSKEAPSVGEIVSWGESVIEEMLKEEKAKVLFRKFAGDEFKVDGNNYIIVPESEILGRIYE